MVRKFILLACSALACSLTSGLAHAAECDAPKNEEQTKQCVGNELKDSDDKINVIYKSLMAGFGEADKATLKAEQRAWIKARTTTCGLNAAIANRELWISDILKSYSKTVCAVSMTSARIRSLQAMQNPPVKQASAEPAPSPVPSPVPAPAAPAAPATAASTGNSGALAFTNEGRPKRPPTIHADGKWYFEFTVNRMAISKISPTLIVMGVSDKDKVTGTMANIRAQEKDDSQLRIGVAVDLDNGKFYTSRNGVWDHAKPGSNEGDDLKLGRNYYAMSIFSETDHQNEILSAKAFVPNFGDDPFAYAIPDGYRPWRNPLP